MRRVLLTAAILAALYASSRAAEGPRIVGPSKVQTGQACVLQLVGLPKPSSFEELIERESLLNEWRVYPKQAEPSFAEPLVFVGASRVALVLQPATSPGTYWLVGHVPAAVGVDCLVEHQITVEGSPNPPPPPPPPPPPEEVAVIIVRETADATGNQAILLQQLRPWLIKQGLPYRIVDDDQVDSTGKTPTWLAAILKSASEASVQLPILAVCSADCSRVVHVEGLPKTAEATIKVIEEHGGK